MAYPKNRSLPSNSMPYHATSDKTLDFCLLNELFNGHEFEQVLHVHLLENQTSVKQNTIKLLNNGNLDKAVQTPQTSNLQDYENIINP